jgi:hypothetical protein
MKSLAFLAALAACHASPPPAHPAPPEQPHPIDAERLPDGPQAMPLAGTPSVTVEGDVISALSCRPGGSMPALVADSHKVYVTFFEAKISAPAGMATPSTYCSYQRFRIPAGLTYGGFMKG